MTITINSQLLMAARTTVTRDDIETIGEFSTSHDSMDVSSQLNSSSTPPVTKKFGDQFTTTQNLDLTALADPELGTLDMSGLKLQVLFVKNLSSANDLVISDAGANPYSINDGSDITIPPGGHILHFYNDQLADVAAGAKGIDFTPTAGQSYQVLMLFG